MSTSDHRKTLLIDGPIVWSDGFLVGYPPLDRIHRDFVDALAAVQVATDDALAPQLAVLAGVARRQFGQEDRWMNDSGFPPRECHVQEHASVMESFALVTERVEAGDLDEGGRFAGALADWFPKHVAHLDSALAHWMFKLEFSGKPIILRRGAAGEP